MAKEKEEKTDREARYEAFVARYAKQNPEKYEAKKAAGQFDKIPDSFQ